MTIIIGMLKIIGPNNSRNALVLPTNDPYFTLLSAGQNGVLKRSQTIIIAACFRA